MHHHTAKNILFFFSKTMFRLPFYVIIILFPPIVRAWFIFFGRSNITNIISNYCRWTFLMLPCVQLNQCLFSIQHPKAAVPSYSLPLSIICPGAGSIHSVVTLLQFSFSLHVYYNILFEIFVLDDRGSKKSKREMRDPQLQPGCWLLTCGLDGLDRYLF